MNSNSTRHGISREVSPLVSGTVLILATSLPPFTRAGGGTVSSLDDVTSGGIAPLSARAIVAGRWRGPRPAQVTENIPFNSPTLWAVLCTLSKAVCRANEAKKDARADATSPVAVCSRPEFPDHTSGCRSEQYRHAGRLHRRGPRRVCRHNRPPCQGRRHRQLATRRTRPRARPRRVPGDGRVGSLTSQSLVSPKSRAAFSLRIFGRTSSLMDSAAKSFSQRSGVIRGSRSRRALCR